MESKDKAKVPEEDTIQDPWKDILLLSFGEIDVKPLENPTLD